MKKIIEFIKNNPKKTITLFLVVVLAAVGITVRGKIRNVTVLPIKKGDLSAAIYGSAQLRTNKTFDLKLGTSARILDMRATVGRKVKKGELLVTFENLPRFEAPIDGTLTAVNYRTGESVFAQAVVLSIVNPEDFFLEMSLDQKSIRYVKEGQAARVSFDGYRDQKYVGRVRSTYSNNSLFYAVIDFENPDSSFLSGMSADVAIVTETRKSVLLAPVGALSQGKILLQRDGGRPFEVEVSTGLMDADFVEIHSDKVQIGDMAVIRSTLPGAAK